ncbi:hypothetical protein [Pyruvatibacter sp.]|uniref:hypothetical protein n=1 Tax=Pyruvatibacter sp. TaxID=1981328 RepID=UPI0032EAF4BD
MVRYSGVIETRKIDRLLTGAELDREKRRALQEFAERMDRTILEANYEVLHAKLPDVTLKTMTRLAVRIAELRAAYLAKALAVADQPGVPTASALDDLQRHRVAFEELREAFEALERVIERGYTTAV